MQDTVVEALRTARLEMIAMDLATIEAAGYFGPPVAGSAEIGYSVIAEARSQGIATECVRALIGRAFSSPSAVCCRAYSR
jgi:RimJ/RimL family protein N-acetyltransferase